MATTRKPGTTHTAPPANRIGEDKSFGRASLMSQTAHKSGLSPHNTNAEDEPVVERDATPVSRTVQPVGHKGH